jgi:hypothetical protein
LHQHRPRLRRDRRAVDPWPAIAHARIIQQVARLHRIESIERHVDAVQVVFDRIALDRVDPRLDAHRRIDGLEPRARRDRLGHADIRRRKE